MAKVTVIIPVYNAEQYIERCAHSLFAQTLEDIEYIFIDDCSPDKSIERLKTVLREYPHRREQVKVIKNERNLKQAGSRNIGMRNAIGEYMIHCDPDDWVDVNMYQSLVDEALRTNSDVTMCDISLERGYKTEICKMQHIDNSHDYINLSRKVQTNWSLCNKLIKSSIIKNFGIYPFEGINYMEDVGICVRVMYHANRLAFINKPFYHYDLSNQGSICHNKDFTSNIQQGQNCIEELEAFFKDKPESFDGFLNTYKLIIKNEYLRLNPKDYTSWRRTFPDLRLSIFSIERFSISLRMGLLGLAYGSKIPYVAQDLFNRIICKIKSLV